MTGVQADRQLFKFFKNGGSADLNVDGSVTPVEFTVQSTNGKDWLVREIVVHMQDGGMTPTEFGGLGAALTNGLLIEVRNKTTDAVILDITGGHPIEDNGEFAHLMSTSSGLIIAAAGDDDFHAVIDFHDGMIVASGEKVVVTVQDDLQALTEFHMILHGNQLP